jgi:hypothetical protein
MNNHSEENSMAKYFLTGVLFLAVSVAPSKADSPSNRYDAALVLMIQANLDVADAIPVTAAELQAASTIDFALGAAVKAADDMLANKDNRINAQSAATTGYLGAGMCYDLYLAEVDPMRAQHWLDAANNAYAAALLLDPHIGGFPF